MPADGDQVREQSRATEHWKGHLDVPRPEPERRLPRAFFLILIASLAMGLLALVALALWSHQASAPDVLAWGVAIISIVCVVVVAAFLLPLPLAMNSTWVSGWSLWGSEPLPLVTPALAMMAFSVPSIVTLVGLLVAAW